MSDLKQSLRNEGERRENLVAQHQIRLNALNEELDSIKAELREKNSEVFFDFKAFVRFVSLFVLGRFLKRFSVGNGS